MSVDSVYEITDPKLKKLSLDQFYRKRDYLNALDKRIKELFPWSIGGAIQEVWGGQEIRVRGIIGYLPQEEKLNFNLMGQTNEGLKFYLPRRRTKEQKKVHAQFILAVLYNQEKYYRDVEKELNFTGEFARAHAGGGTILRSFGLGFKLGKSKSEDRVFFAGYPSYVPPKGKVKELMPSVYRKLMEDKNVVSNKACKG